MLSNEIKSVSTAEELIRQMYSVKAESWRVSQKVLCENSSKTRKLMGRNSRVDTTMIWGGFIPPLSLS